MRARTNGRGRWVRAVVERHVERRTFGILGKPRVNVFALTLALDNP